jgi:hypothetical protein
MRACPTEVTESIPVIWTFTRRAISSAKDRSWVFRSGTLPLCSSHGLSATALADRRFRPCRKERCLANYGFPPRSPSYIPKIRIQNCVVVPSYWYASPIYVLCLPLLRKHPGCIPFLPILEPWHCLAANRIHLPISLWPVLANRPGTLPPHHLRISLFHFLLVLSPFFSNCSVPFCTHTKSNRSRTLRPTTSPATLQSHCAGTTLVQQWAKFHQAPTGRGKHIATSRCLRLKSGHWFWWPGFW